MKTITLDFGSLQLQAELFDSPPTKRFVDLLPCTVELIQWGRELYGPLPRDLGSENPVPSIPPGGIAYSRQGHYLCIFFGQTPAWEVDHIGQITGDNWKLLLNAKELNRVTIELII